MIWRIAGRLLAAIGGAVVLFAGAALAYNTFAHYQVRLDGWPSRSDFAPPAAWSPDEPGKVRILALDGGGLYGLAWLEILKDLEKQSGRPIAEMFDFVAGTSTGAIIGALLLTQDENGKPKYNAGEIEKIYLDLSRRIFDVPTYHKILTVNGLLGPRFFNHGKFIESREVFQGSRFGALLRPMMIPTYSRKNSGLREFINVRDPDANLRLGPLLAAASSVPGMFPGVRLAGDEPDAGFYDDAGFILNNPAHRAFEYVLARNPKSNIVVVSIGPTPKREPTNEVSVNAGFIAWLTPVFRMIFKGQSDLSTDSLETLETIGTVVKLEAFRLAVPMAHVSPFDPSQANIERIEKAGDDYIKANQDLLGKVLESLKPGRSSDATQAP